MIHVEKGHSIPDELSLPDSMGVKERRAAIEFYANPEYHGETFKYRAYKEKGVIELLNHLFHGKCAYCESKYLAVHPMDVEHFRPKAAVACGEEGQQSLRKPGYYWLAAEWCNLLPSCIDCNRERKHGSGSGKPALKYGKGNRFPIADETKRARWPGEEVHEAPLLLNPALDFPEQHLEFTADGIVRAELDAQGNEDLKGKLSIEVYGLQRPSLVQERRGWAIKVLAQIEVIKDYTCLLNEFPDDIEIQSRLYREIKYLLEYTQPDQLYAGMARQLIYADQFIQAISNEEVF